MMVEQSAYTFSWLGPILTQNSNGLNIGQMGLNIVFYIWVGHLGPFCPHENVILAKLGVPAARIPFIFDKWL